MEQKIEIKGLLERTKNVTLVLISAFQIKKIKNRLLFSDTKYQNLLLFLSAVENTDVNQNIG